MVENVDLSEKTVIVTGGGRGLGEATAKAFGSYGANVVVNDLGVSLEGDETDSQPATQTAEAIREEGGSAEAHFGDISDLSYCEDLVEFAVDNYGRLDVVVNFAGILRDSFLVNMTEEEWDKVIQVHLKGHFALLRAAGRHWREASKESDGFDSERSFIAISSASARGSAGQVNYAAAKAGILGVMRTGARELTRYDVRVNAMMPVAFTRMIEDIPEEHLPDIDPEKIGPDRVAPMVVFLGSDEAEGVTGCTFACGGDGLIYVTDPELRSSAYADDGWTVEEIVDRFDQVTDMQQTAKLEPGGLLSKLS